jgi:hypothetical protein
VTVDPRQPRVLAFGGRDRGVLAPSFAETAFAWFLRAVALYCLAAGIFYWVRLIGFYPGALWRFDLMPVHWQIAAPALAVLFPFAAIGLWMVSSWGPVIWVICAASEVVMYAGMPARFGHAEPIVAMHAAIAAIYVFFRLLIFFQRRRAALTVH